MYQDEGNIVALASFFYGMAVTSPFNFITFQLTFFERKMPDYPFSYIVTFAVNGVMVLVVLLCLAVPRIASHSVKINLALFISGLLTLFMPIVASIITNESILFVICVIFLALIGIT